MRHDGRAPGSLLTIVVPVYNEEETVAGFHAALRPVIAEILDDLGQASAVELLFVDDGSTDRTLDEIRRLPAQPATIRLIKLSRNFGKDSALSAGLLHSRGDAVVPMDVDLQDPPALLLKMIRLWREGAKVVNAVRDDRASDNFFKRRSAETFYRVYNRLADHKIAPNVGDFRLLDREVVDLINGFPERIRFMKGLFSWVGFSPATVHYDRPERSEGATKWRAWSLWNFALDGITGSTTLPLRIWTYLGTVLGLSALAYAAFIIVRTLIFGVDAPGYASLMVVTLTIGAANMISIGILGEYVGRISVEVRSRPTFIVDYIEERAPSHPPDLLEVGRLPGSAKATAAAVRA